jgi:hypothetical protein
MGSVTLDTWERFYERVVKQGNDWPRNLWLAAVDDGLRAALPAQSRLLVQYRQDVAALRELERAAPGSYRDSTRMAQLEADIMRLIALADEAIREESAAVPEMPERPVPPPARSHPRIGFWLGTLILGVITLCGALLGVTYYQQLRMGARMQHDLTALQDRLLEQAADQRAALEVRIRSAEARQQTFGALQAELRANVDEFNKLLSAALRSMTALGDSVTPGHERRLASSTGGSSTKTVELCFKEPGFEVDLYLVTTLPDMIYIYRGDLPLARAIEQQRLEAHGAAWAERALSRWLVPGPLARVKSQRADAHAS